jgi:hypothetical protein
LSAQISYAVQRNWKAAMTETEADKCIADYRSLLKEWTMTITGIKNNDAYAIERQLDESQHKLAEIAVAFPAKAYSIDLLVNARTRTWAGYEEDRIPRPDMARKAS